MFGLPDIFIGSIIFLVGLIFGSFFDVLVSRFHTGKSINGRSHCLSCGHTLSWFELFPVLSFILLKGKCRSCHAKIPARLFLMEICTGLLFLYVFLNSLSFTSLIFGLALMALFIVIGLYDMRHMIIPNSFVLVAFLFAFIHLLLTLEKDILWFFIHHVTGGLVAGFFYGMLWLISKGRWIGLGDAKLALPLGLMLSYTGVFSFIVLSFWVGAGISLVLLSIQWLLKRGKQRLPFWNIPLTMKSEVPFAPFMLIAFVLVYFSHIDVFSILKLSF